VRGRKKTAASAPAKAVVGYVRVSTEEQATSGVSLEAQESRIRAYAVAIGREFDEVIVDAGVSAKTLVRPGMSRVLAGVRDGSIGTVIALKLDRLTRSTRDLGDLLEIFKRSGAALVSISESLDTETAAGRMVVNMLGVVAQWEREAIAERTAIALGHKREQRTVYGSTPFGYRREGERLVADDAQHAALRTIREMLAAGASLRQVAARLTDDGVPPPRGRAWYGSSVRAIANSRIYTETGQ
jgi:DNA invertase Pin-like site-specific DNA recombinase